LEGVLNNKAENMEKPLEQKLNKIKEALSKLGNDEAQQ
jgi:hypothetical protein